MLAELGQFYGWARHELLDLTVEDIAWWLGAAREFTRRVTERADGG